MNKITIIDEIMNGNDNLRNIKNNPISEDELQNIIDLWDLLLMNLNGNGYDLMDLPISALRVVAQIDSILNSKKETKK